MKRITYLIIGLIILSRVSFAADPSRGKAAYIANCLNCHGAKGDGLGPAGKYMSPKPQSFVTGKFKNGDTDAAIFKSVTSGLDGTGMPGFMSIPESDRWAIVHYIQSFKTKK